MAPAAVDGPTRPALVRRPPPLRLTGSPLAPRWRGRSHLGALVIAVPVSVALVERRPSAAIIVYAVSLVALFAASSAYHLLPVGVATRNGLRRVDHVMIYLFTAASYGPFCLRVAPGRFGIVVLGQAWLGAGAGVAIKCVGFRRLPIVASALYLALGWLAVITLPDAVRLLSAGQLALVASTGAWFTVGAVVLFTRRPDPFPAVFGYHEVWHAAVVAGVASWFVLVWQLAR